MIPQTPTSSHSKTARALRAFILSSALWGAWGQMLGIGTAVFTGFVLFLGASDSEIAYLVSIASFASLGQILSSLTADRIGRKKLWMLIVGMFEMGFRFTIVLTPLFFSDGRMAWIGLLLGLGLACGHIVSPVYNGWLASTIPGDIRARFTGRQTAANLIAGMVASYLAGWYVDRFTEIDRFAGFLAVFVVATGLGLAGYLNLMRVPFRESAPSGPAGSLFAPFRDARFRSLLLFFLFWNFALGIAGPFYSVFMLRTLSISYTTVAILNSLFMAAMVAGYRVWGGLVDRYGSKAVLQILVPPTLLIPVLWVFNRPDAYWLIPVAMLLSGLLHSGIMVSTSALLYGILPENGKTAYFAGWSCAINLAYAIAPLLGSALVRTLEPVEYTWLSCPVGNLQLVFLVSSAGLLLPVLLLRRVEDIRGTTPGQLLTQIGRGNLLGYIYSSLLYDRTREVRTRARAARSLGRSRSPMALDRLIKALEDASPDVRRQAARGLGEARAPEAVASLLKELRDDESDLRVEAAEALGQIGDPSAIDPLLEALDDSDTRVRISAIRALAEIGGEEVNEILFWRFAETSDRAILPALIEALGRAGDLRIVRPTLERLTRFRSPAIRMQLFNGVCHALGDGGRFYLLLSRDDLSRAELLDDMIRRTRRALRRSRVLPADLRSRAAAELDAFLNAFDAGQPADLAGAARRFAALLETGVGARTVDALGTQAATRIAAAVLAVKLVLDTLEIPEPETPIRDAFLIVCLWRIGNALDSARKSSG